VANVVVPEEVPVKDSFRPGSIHETQFRSFWEEELKASKWVLDTLEKGYRLPFDREPGPYEEENNATARRRPDVVRKIVREMIEQKIVEVVDKPICVSPLGLVERNNKFRLVWDASRWVNLFLKNQKVTLTGLDKALELTQRDDWQTVFDLQSAYYNIKIADEHQKFLGAAMINEDKSKTYFIYKVLPFGLSSAVHAITKLWKPILAYLHLKNIPATIYIDDGRLVSKSATEAESNRKFVYEVVTSAGWQISKEKSDGEGGSSQVKSYLGIV
jgi:hypothetical protein